MRKPGNFDLDGCAWTFSVAKACMLLSKHKIFKECKEVFSYVTEAMPKMILIHDRQVFKKKSYVVGKSKFAALPL